MKRMQICSLATLSLCREIKGTRRKKQRPKRIGMPSESLSEEYTANFGKLPCDINSLCLSSDFQFLKYFYVH